MIDRSTLNTFKQGIVKGLGFGVGASIALATTTLLAAAAAMKVFSAGEVISATELNRNFTIAGPEGEVSAFYLSDCPEGWTIANGSNGTPDLRGRFIRGLDNMGGTAAGVDPDSSRGLGSEQDDRFQGHWHWRNTGQDAEHDMSAYSTGSFAMGFGGNHSMALSYTGNAVNDGVHGDPRVSRETRPRNVALIYCMRKN
ncbi:MAG: tail fiber protein [Leptonema illini]|jgi:hypothetical protein|uniref:Tail fiber protein n=1 Tax=Leptonema illini TaxID=183 RepID=A0A833GZQ8_9LEPT|nr:MAG: tail fiber protein [Leptonema illini]